MSAASPEAPPPPDLLGDSLSLIKAKERLSRAAKVDRPVLILGGRGTGKELAAARLHFLSPRWRGPYVTLNCAALSPSLLDAELFGYEAGSFTGAGKRRPGRFEAADGGTLFLDEISHLTLEAQARILRVVEYGSFQMVGSASERRIDVRVVAATNADLRRMCREGSFLPDLWDRLSFEIIELPPLKNRPGDVNLLAHYFGARMARELDRSSPPVLSPEALAALEAYDWPGNVRELKNVIERAVYHQSFEKSGALIEPGDLQLETGLYASAPEPPDSMRLSASMAEPRPSAVHGLLTAHGLSANSAAPDSTLPASALASPAHNLANASAPNSASAPTAGPFRPTSSAGDWPASAGLGALPPGGYDHNLEKYARSLIEAAMSASGHHQGRAAELLGLSYHKFRSIRHKLFKNQGG